MRQACAYLAPFLTLLYLIPAIPSLSIIQRAGIVPLSVAGVFKEVTTISIASWAFGDEITPINVAGLAVTMIGATCVLAHSLAPSAKPPVLTSSTSFDRQAS